LLTDVLRIHPELESTAYLVRHVEAFLNYPITEPAVVHQLAAQGSLRAGRCMVELPHVQQHLRKESFPIESRDQLIQQVLFAVMRAHGYEYTGDPVSSGV